MTVELAALAVVLAVIGLVFVYTVRTGNSPMPTSPRVKAVLLEAIPADLEGTIFELGSGWGTLAIPLARRFPRCTVVAYELSPVPWLASRVRHALRPLPNLTLLRADFHQAPLADAALVVCYLFPSAMRALKPKLESELRPGAIVVSNFFAVPGWQPQRVRTANDLYHSKVYLYRMPAPA